MTLRTIEQAERFVVEIADDGRGIDWQSVAKRAKAAGLPAETQYDLEQALFVDGLSTAASVTDVSGRGVGMGALLAATKAMDGQLSVQSELHRGTRLHFSFPVRKRESGYPRAVSNGAEP